MTLSWLSIVRLGLVQMCLGGIVVLTTSTLNRLMIVELSLPAILPGFLVALHYGVQITRPNWGFRSDTGGKRTFWIIAGMAALAAGAMVAALCIPLLATNPTAGIAISVLAYALIGLGVGASGTSLLALLATATAPRRRAAAATITWLMMIAGIAVTAATVGIMLEPYSADLLIRIVAIVTSGAVLLTCLAVWGVERGLAFAPDPAPVPFTEALAELWGEARTRNFTLFVFLSMTAYFMQELILEPYAGLVFGFTPGQSTMLSGAQNGGVFLGMLTVGIAATGFRIGALRTWVVTGCVGSAASLSVIASLGALGPGAPLVPAVVSLGFFNGVFAVAAIGSMMGLAGEGRETREGTRMGLWGAAQAIAAGFGGLVGAAAADALRVALGSDASAFGTVFAAEAALFLLAALMAARIMERRPGITGHLVAGNDMRHDVIVVGGGPAGATAAEDLARSGVDVAFLDRDGRIKPCGGAIPPRLIEDFLISDEQLVAKIRTARMVSPSGRSVDIPIENGFVGMVDREHFDEYLRVRATEAGATRYTGTFKGIDRDSGTTNVIYRDKESGEERRLATKLIIGADGARSNVARLEVPGGDKIPYVIAYHEIIAAPEAGGSYDAERCDVIYDGAISPDFYGWVFPHGKSASVGMGTGLRDVDLKQATADLRVASGLEGCETIRTEGAPIPLQPLPRWDNGRDVVLAGDAAGVVAPSSGEGIYYAMVGGRVAATAAAACLASNRVADLRLARKLFMSEHKTVFRVLASMQNAYYRSDDRRERFVSLCHDIDVQRLTFEAYMNKKLVKARPLAHLKIGLKNVAHLTGLVRANHV